MLEKKHVCDFTKKILNKIQKEFSNMCVCVSVYNKLVIFV